MKCIAVDINIVYSKGEPQMSPIVNIKTRGIPPGIVVRELKQVVERLEGKNKKWEESASKQLGGLPVNIDHLNEIELNRLLDECEEFDPTDFSES